MSQRPASRSNFLQIMLFAIVAYLGLTLLTQGMQGPPDTRSSEQLLNELRKANSELRDNTAAALLPVYEKKVRAESQGKLSQAEIDKKLLEGLMLVVDARLKSGIQRNSTNKLNLGYMAIYPKQRNMQGLGVWKQEYPIPAPSNQKTAADFSWRSWSPEQLYDRVTKELGSRYKHEPVWGLFNGYALIDSLVAITGRVPGFSYAFAALLLALFVRILIWPLAQKQIMWGRRMTQLAPMLKELQQQYMPKGKPGGFQTNPEYQQKVMELYKEYGVNPFSGCGPILLQMPLFLLIYQCMVHYRFEFKQGTFLWVNPSLAEQTSGWIGRSLGDMDYILIVLYGISMLVSTLVMPVSDPQNAKQSRIMGVGIGIFFTIMMFFWPIPSAFVLYWIFSNVLGTAQALLAYRKPLPVLAKVNAPHGAVYPVNGSANGSAVVGGTLFQDTGKPKQLAPKRGATAGKAAKAKKRKR